MLSFLSRFALIIYLLPLSLIAKPQDQSNSFDLNDPLQFHLILHNDTADMEWISFLIDAPPQPDFSVKNGQSIIMKPQVNQATYDWVFYFILLIVMLFAYIKMTYSKALSDLFQGFFSIGISQQIFREQETFLPLSAILLNVLFVITLGTYLFLIFDSFQLILNGGPLFLLCIGAVGLLSFIRYTTLKFLAYIFPFKQELDFYNFSFFMVLKVSGVILIPFLILLAYASEFIVTWASVASLIILAGLIIFTFFKGIQIGKDFLIYRKFHFFVYFCTLEISPALIIIETINRWILI